MDLITLVKSYGGRIFQRNSPIYIETKTQHKSALDKVSLGHETLCLNEFA